MGRTLNENSLQILALVSKWPEIPAKELYEAFKKKMYYKDFYNALFRLSELGLLKKEKALGINILTITDEGKKAFTRASPQRDGVWKLVIFDIPEKHKFVRSVLRGKLKAIHFKKWQNSIYASPYALDEEVEEELKQLAKKYFIRLIKTTDINDTSDLETLFE